MAKPTDIVSIKAAVKLAVAMAGGPNAASAFTRVNASHLSQCGNDREPSNVALDVALDLDKKNSDPVILRAYAGLLGYDIVQREPSKEDGKQIIAQAGDVAEQSGELVSEIIRSAGDGEITPNEAKRIDGEAADLNQIVCGVRKTTHQVIARVA